MSRTIRANGSRRKAVSPRRRLALQPLENRLVPTTYIVDALNDEIVDTDGKISLREAINLANATPTTDDTITYDPAVFGVFPETIELTLGELTITDALEVTASGVPFVTVDAKLESRVVRIEAGGEAVGFNNMTLKGGKPADGNGGGVLVLSAGSVTFTSSSVSNSTSAFGTGIWAQNSALVLNTSAVQGNIATNSGGGVWLSNTKLALNDSASISQNTAEIDGGGVQADASSAVTVTGSSLASNHAITGRGGAIFTDGPLTLNPGTTAGTETAVFLNTAGTDGGGIWSSNVTKLLGNEFAICLVYNNEAKGNGGGIFANSGQLIISSASISLNKADSDDDKSGDGGGIYCEMASLTVNKAAGDDSKMPEIKENYAVNGGGVFGGGTFTNAKILANKADQNGGGINGGGCTLTSTFVLDNQAIVGNGGGLRASGTVVIAAKSEFLGNTAGTNGGGLHFSGTEIQILDSKVENCDALGGDGGGAWLGAGTHLIRDSVIGRGCQADKSGGAIRLTGGDLNVLRGEIGNQDSSAQVNGGGLSAVGGTVTASLSTLGGRLTFLTFDADTKGGGVYTEVSTKLTACSISGTGEIGGGLYALKGTTTLEMCSVSGTASMGFNTAEPNGLGGAIFVDNAATVTVNKGSPLTGTAYAAGGAAYTRGALTISSTTIKDSNAYGEGNGPRGGGGLYVASGTLSLVASTVNNNKAAENPFTPPPVPKPVIHGGGILVAGGAVEMKNCTISGNTAYHGGGIATSGVLVQAFNCTITQNVATGDADTKTLVDGQGGGFHGTSAPSVLNLRSTIIADNIAVINEEDTLQMKGPDIWAQNKTVNATYSLVGVGDSDFVKSTTWATDHNREGTLAAPLSPGLDGLAFNGGPTFTHRLLPGSQAIDGGQNQSGSPNDQRGSPLVRTYNHPTTDKEEGGDETDIGAYELQAPKVVSVITFAESPVANSSVILLQPSRSRVTNMVVTFNQPVEFAGSPDQAFTLERTGGPAGPPANPYPVGVVNLPGANVQGSTVVFSWSGSVEPYTEPDDAFRSWVDGKYRLTLPQAKVNVSGLPLNASTTDPAGSPFDSDAAPDPAERLFRLFGDVQGLPTSWDRDVDANDFGIFRGAFGSSSGNGTPNFNFIVGLDFDGDGDVDADDFGKFRARFGSSV